MNKLQYSRNLLSVQVYFLGAKLNKTFKKQKFIVKDKIFTHIDKKWNFISGGLHKVNSSSIKHKDGEQSKQCN